MHFIRAPQTPDLCPACTCSTEECDSVHSGLCFLIHKMGTMVETTSRILRQGDSITQEKGLAGSLHILSTQDMLPIMFVI